MSLAWGGYSNGLIPQSVLVFVGNSDADHGSEPQYLEAGAARAYVALDRAFFAEFEKHLVVNAGNRPLPVQKELYAAYQTHPATNPLAAYPGTSNHGWGRACDFGSNVQYAGTPEALWMREHAKEYGFHDSGYGFSRVEPWHYDWIPGTATASLDATPIIEQKDDDMTLYYQPTNNSSPLKDGTSRIWAGSRTVAGIDYADVWGASDIGEVRRLTRKQWVDLTANAKARDIALPVLDCSGNELEQLVYAPRL